MDDQRLMLMSDMHTQSTVEEIQRKMSYDLYNKFDIEVLAKSKWEAAGWPQDRDIEFWSEAERELQSRACGASGNGADALSQDEDESKRLALLQFSRRRCYSHLATDPLDRMTLPLGHPYSFYCKYCGVHVETVPSDFMFRVRKHCSQCDGLILCKWLAEAILIAEAAGHVLKEPRKFG